MREAIADQSEWLRSRIRFEEVSGGNRTMPLNFGLSNARGRYVVILDDDDIVFANWLEVFRDLALQRPGSLLRAASVRQEFTYAFVDGKRAARAVSGMHRDYNSEFDFLEHLEVSQTPPVSIAFPRYLFERHHLKFDADLTTTEDWDYIMRTASVAGVASSREITSIYRWWVDADSSRTMHDQNEWSDNHDRIWAKIDERVNLFETGSTLRFREVTAKMNEYLRWANKLHNDLLEIQRGVGEENGPHADKIRSLSQKARGNLAAIMDGGSLASAMTMLPEKDLLPPPPMPGLIRFVAGAAAIRRRREAQRIECIKSSGIFDADWYLATYQDVAQSGADPLMHFIKFGSFELRSPSAQFDAKHYYMSYPDLQDQKIEPVFHFVLHGKREGRRIKPHS